MAEKSWRPKNWRKTRNKILRDMGYDPRGYPVNISEAGADAMLGALYGECQKYGGKWMKFDKTDSGDIIVYLDG